VVCRSVSLSVTIMSLAKPAETIVIPFVILILVGSRNRVLDGDLGSHTRRGNFAGEKDSAGGHAWTCPAVDIFEATRQGQLQYSADAD